MADFTVSGLDEMEALILQRSEAVNVIAPEMLNAGAKILIAAQKAELRQISTTDRSIGTLANSIGTGGVKKSADGLKVYIDVYPQGDQPHGSPGTGTRNNGKKYKRGKSKLVSNAQVGFTIEYGSSEMRARPWRSVAAQKCAAAVHEAMRKVWEEKQNG